MITITKALGNEIHSFRCYCFQLISNYSIKILGFVVRTVNTVRFETICKGESSCSWNRFWKLLIKAKSGIQDQVTKSDCVEAVAHLILGCESEPCV